MNRRVKTCTVFIHRSIKTRIETIYQYHQETVRMPVFIHRSIKTRIETLKCKYTISSAHTFLYIDPLKQGLKQ